ncbi:hypothetical protein FKM82_018778 [Ascaphus truei]
MPPFCSTTILGYSGGTWAVAVLGHICRHGHLLNGGSHFFSKFSVKFIKAMINSLFHIMHNTSGYPLCVININCSCCFLLYPPGLCACIIHFSLQNRCCSKNLSSLRHDASAGRQIISTAILLQAHQKLCPQLVSPTAQAPAPPVDV